MRHEAALEAVIFCFSLFMMFAPGCCPISSLNPLSDPKNAWYDNRLTGAWCSTIDGDSIYLHIGKGRDNLTQVHPVKLNKNGTLEVNETYTAFPTSLGGENMLNIRMPSPVEGKEEGYLFFRYEMKDSRVLIYSWDDKAILEAILNRELKGETAEKPEVPEGKQEPGREKKLKCLRIIDDTQHLIQYLNKAGVKKLFSKPVGTFERLEAKPSRKAPPGSDESGKSTL
jgi:hypothetical protein